MNNITPGKYLALFGVVAVIGVVLLSALAIQGLFRDQVFTYQALYEYQIGKLAKDGQFDTVFVGDSSLGNSIDAEVFGELTGTAPVNLALTGMYGFAGYYNMAKLAADSQPIKNIIIMVTLSTWQKPVSYQGYLYTLRGWADIAELTVGEQWQLARAFLNSTLSPETLRLVALHYVGRKTESIPIENDYIKQITWLDVTKEVGRVAGAAAPGKTGFLNKLVSFSAERNINLLFVHGPYLESPGAESAAFVMELNKLLKSSGIAYLPELVLIESEHIGDSVNHVHPDFKRLYTARLAKLINPMLEARSGDPAANDDP